MVPQFMITKEGDLKVFSTDSGDHWETIVNDVLNELHTASVRFPPMATAMDGVGILREEFEELWDEVKTKQGLRSEDRLRKEAIQVAAMALRFIHDICEQGRAQK